MRKSSVQVLIFVVGVLLAESCGGGAEEKGPPAATPTSTATAAAEAVVQALPTATPPSTLRATPTARSERLREEVNRIAIVGLDGQIYTIDTDGSHSRRISPETGVFTWPTWSPDARKLAFSGVNEDEGGNLRISLFVFSSASSKISELYVGEPGVAGLLAEEVVQYALWSPDSAKLAFVVLTSQGQSLFLDDPRDSVGPTLVLDQGPLWMSWSPDSQYLLVHRGADHFLVNTLEGIRVDDVGISASGYRVPAWRPPGAIVTLASEDGPGRYTILNAEVDRDGLGVQQPITSLREIGFPLTPAFIWSPSGEVLALAGSTLVVSYLGLPIFVYRDLVLLFEGEAAQEILIQDDVIAYFWSPDSSRLAYVSPSPIEGSLRWTVLNVVNGDRWPLVDFIPSRDQLTVFQFFDQYAYSHSLWSPDSRSLVFAGKLTNRATPAFSTSDVARQGSHIIVVGTDPGPSTQTIADGILGFWSPR